MTVTAVKTTDYEKIRACECGKNKPKQTHFYRMSKNHEKSWKKRVKALKLLSFQQMDDKNSAYSVNSAKVKQNEAKAFQKETEAEDQQPVPHHFGQ